MDSIWSGKGREMSTELRLGVDEAAYYYLFEWLQANDPGPRQAARGFGLRDCRGHLVMTMDQLMMALENGGLWTAPKLGQHDGKQTTNTK